MFNIYLCGQDSLKHLTSFVLLFNLLNRCPLPFARVIVHTAGRPREVTVTAGTI